MGFLRVVPALERFPGPAGAAVSLLMPRDLAVAAEEDREAYGFTVVPARVERSTQ